MKASEYLVDHLGRAEVNAPDANFVSVQNFSLDFRNKTTIFQHPNSQISFASVELGRQPVLKLACGIRKTAWARLGSAVRFEVFAEGGARRLFELTLDPRRNQEHRRWNEVEIDLGVFAQGQVELVFKTSVLEGQSNAYAWCGWGEPHIEHQVDSVQAPAVHTADRHHHIFLVVADALRRDALGCYGSREVETPHIDQLARQGVLFDHARAQTPTTLGSYTSLLTGRPPIEHGIVDEWGTFPAHMLSLPTFLEGCGYHTALAVSEAELQDKSQGFDQVFNVCVPCLANPAQDGSITTRHFLRFLDHRPDRPLFAMVQYFDTHPPNLAGVDFRDKYYAGDPRAEERRCDADFVGKIRGVESMLELERAAGLWARGGEDAMVVGRLRGTAQALSGHRRSGPDLARHILGVGRAAQRGMEVPQFARWLAKQVDQLEKGVATPDLVAWVREVLPILKDIETEILTWLEGVVDFRYPLAQYRACVAYLDYQVGQLVAGLKERGIYDQSTIIFTSPHGEVLNNMNICFHHHVLFEEVLQVPLIIKPSEGLSHAIGARICGVIDSVDLFPTVLDMLGLYKPAGLGGQSHWHAIKDGAALPERDSLAMANHGVMWSLYAGGFKYVKALAPHHVSPQWSWRKEECALYEVARGEGEDLLAQKSEVAAEMERRLAAAIGIGKDCG